MTRTQNPTLQLPAERLGQIKAIGAALGGLSITDTIGYLVRQEIERGTIPDTLPGVEIAATAEGVTLAFLDGSPVVLARDRALALAKTVSDFVDSKEAAGTVYNVDHGYIVARQGNGIKLTVPAISGMTKSLSRDVARDFARLMSTAAA